MEEVLLVICHMIYKDIQIILLETLPNTLETLMILDCHQITDFRPLSSLINLNNLNLNGTHINNLSVLPINITELNISLCYHITDFTPLSRLVKLKLIYLDQQQVETVKKILPQVKIIILM